MSYRVNPIETVYNGYRFRSRTEARWAVFFDTLEIPYQYEVEGFELDGCGRYLPDFYLSPIGFDPDEPGYYRDGCWVEVKGSSPSQEDIAKVRALCAARQQFGFILVGNPGRSKVIYVPEKGDVEHFSEEGVDAITPHFLWLVCGFICRSNLTWPLNHDDVEPAVKAAMSARFEFGETPNYGRKRT